MSTLKDYYNSTVAPAMMKKFNYENVMQIPKLDKVVVNVAAGEAKENAKVIDAIMTDLAAITGQKPVVCRAKKSVANFKLREGMPIGVKVTLRGEKMYEFVYKLFNVSFPRVRDFRGINGNSFDGKGNYSTGIKEQLIFPEISTSSQRHRPMRKQKNCSLCSVHRSRSNQGGNSHGKKSNEIKAAENSQVFHSCLHPL